jgi:signal transduction histidine kinase
VKVAAEERILVLAPTGRDGALVCSVLQGARIACLACETLDEVCAELAHGASALMVAEEALVYVHQRRLIEWLDAQPQWSDLPVLLLARRGADSVTLGDALEQLVNVTVVERPTRIATLVSVARTAIRARRRQYQTRRHLEERELVENLLRANDRRKDEFLAVLAHELRNPLAPIASALHIFRLQYSADPEFARLSEMMGRQVEHLVRLVDDLLEVSRITRGKIELRRAPVRLEDVVRQAIDASRPMIDAAGHELVLEMPPQPITIEADAVRLAQVFSNLLNNAAKYTDPGGTIHFVVSRTDEEVLASVRDSGIGIPASALETVFEMFTQVEPTVGRSNGGLGIGLTLVKSIVELHGGTVTAASEGPGMGSEFVVRLPVPSPANAESHVPRVMPESQVSGRRILVVDDNRDAATSLARLLELLGAEAEVVHNGEDALHALSPGSHDLVLLDIGMPGMDGYEVARRIRSRPDLEGLLLVALSGWGQVEDVRRSAEAGLDCHLIKPVDVATLNRRLAMLAH